MADVDGEVTNTQSQNSTLYAALESDRGLEIAAIDIDDGNIRWSVAVSGEGEYNPRFSLGTTSVGVMTSYLDDKGGHLVLLDEETGDRRWDIPLDSYAYELDGEIVDGVGALSPDEGSSMLVDLRTGEELDGLDITFAIDGRGAIQDGSLLRVDLDPLDPTTGGREIDLGDDAPVCCVAQFEDTLIILTEAGTLSGYVDDQRHWTLDVSAIQVDDVALYEDVLVVTEDVAGDAPTVDQEWHYFAIDGAEPTPIDDVPARFEPKGAGLVNGAATIVGRVDETPDMDSDDEIEQVFVVAFESGNATTLGTLEVPAFGTVAVLGDYLLVEDDEGALQVFTLDGIEKSGTVTVPSPEPFETTGSFTIDDEYVLVVDGSRIMNYR
jgi:hypothetical protein